MDLRNTQSVTPANAERVLHLLTTQQHLHPSSQLQQVVVAVCEDHGVDDSVGHVAIAQAGLSAGLSVGRLSRGQIRNLAAQLGLAWQQNIAGRIGANPQSNLC